MIGSVFWLGNSNNHEYHGRVTSRAFSYSFGHFLCWRQRLRGDWERSRKNHPNNDYPVAIGNYFESGKWFPKTEKCGRLSKTSAMKNRDIPTPWCIAEGNQISSLIELLLENRTQAVCYHICFKAELVQGACFSGMLRNFSQSNKASLSYFYCAVL